MYNKMAAYCQLLIFSLAFVSGSDNFTNGRLHLHVTQGTNIVHTVTVDDNGQDMFGAVASQWDLASIANKVLVGVSEK